ncbi:MAG: hypothetical protein M0R77_18475 [Gammaproteobacteria bacterium]|jgi:hypothetical protein|nr:hypothetical protein [Gammaproteobacteria bacterium]
MAISKSHEENKQRLDELSDRQQYMNEFFDEMMTLIQRPSNLHVLKSQPYFNMMKKLTFIHELRSKISKRGNELSLKSILTSEDLEELHSIRIIDSGHIDCIWISIREFLAQTKLKINIDERRT